MYEKVLKKIKPSKEETVELNKVVDEFLLYLDSSLSNCKYILGGSYAKDTWLAGDHDIDIFISFKNEKNISDKLEKYIRRSFSNYERIHGSRDYFIINFKEIYFELIPVFDIRNYKQAKNITDVSTLHVKWVKKNIKDLNDDVRLAKQFCKANRVYGAETYIKGFSGYLLEILIVYYGGFNKFISAAAKWKDKIVIDINKNSDFKSSQDFPLIVIDPVQPSRNAASALSFENFEKFRNICKKFLKNKNLAWFKEKKINLKNYNLLLKVKPLEGNSDVVGTKMLKAYEMIKHELNSKGFIVNKSIWFWNKEGGYFCYKTNDKLDKNEKLIGPPLEKKKHVLAFKNKYKKFKFGEEKKRIYVIKPRKYTKVKHFINVLVNDEYIKNRIKKIKLI